MQLKKTAVAVLFGLGFASFVQAAPDTPETKDLGELSLSRSAIQWAEGHINGSGTFEYVYGFSVADDLLGVSTYASVFDISWVIGNGVSNMSDLLVSIYKGTDTSPVFRQVGTLDSFGNLGVTGSFVLDSSAYTLVIGGKTSGGNNGYSFSLTAAVPVPEPETYAMLLAGLGIVGAVARRRTRTH
ncbi:MAG: FxDxF family PEP-CTERM protein [Azoarcus sp.]|nr:FxDxF family PEP-CTERM protein [Azoarcus sp.]